MQHKLFRVPLCAALVGLLAHAVSAHPLGNDSITHFSVLYFFPDRIELDFLLDIAETPASLAQKNEIDTDRDGADSPEEQRAWLDRMAAELRPLLTMTLDGKPLAVLSMERDESPHATATTAPSHSPPMRIIIKIPGVADMPTYRLLIRYKAPLPHGMGGRTHELLYSDATFPQTRGLKRILLEKPNSPRVTIMEKDCGFWRQGGEDDDPFNYDLYDPSNLPQERTGRIVFQVSGAPETDPMAVTSAPTDSAPPVWGRLTDPRNNPARQEKYRRWADNFADILRGGISMQALALIAFLCFGYGAAHALAPGHAKTIVAAYLITLHGTYLHATLLALIVTCTHTALVIGVGIVFLKLPSAGTTLQLWLGLTAGAMIAGMGGLLMFRAITGRLLPHDHGHETELTKPHGWRAWMKTLFTHSHPHVAGEHPGHSHAHDHPHPHPHPHSHEAGHHHDHDHHDHDGHHHHHEPAPTGPRLTIPLLLWLGISGGIVPCPAAVWMMLLAIGQGKTAVGLFAVCVFSVGLALTLMVIGFAALSSRRFALRLMGEEGSRHWLSTVLPALGGLAVLGLGAIFITHYAWALLFNETLFSFLG